MRILPFVPCVLAVAVVKRTGNDLFSLAGPELTHWPVEAAKAINAVIAAKANSSNYAVFDMDDTTYKNDIEYALLPYLENVGAISRDTLPQSLRLIPFKDDTESLWSYYRRLCGLDPKICHSFAVTVWSGMPLSTLKGHVDDLLAHTQPVKTHEYINGTRTEVEIAPPVVFRGQVELFNRLMANGISVYIISAAVEEIVRMVASDPKYGYNVPPENVIGVTLLLNSSSDFTTARMQIEGGTYNNSNGDASIMPWPWSPVPRMAGTWASVLDYISDWKLPVMAGGDSPESDGPMIFHGVDRVDGIKLWVNKKASSMEEIAHMNTTFAAQQAAEGRPVTADKGWGIVTPEDIL